MWRDSTPLEGTLWIFALAAFLAFGFTSCQNKGSNPAGEDWQAMYGALSEEEQVKLGDGLKSVVTSGLFKETIVGGVFDSTYAIDTSGEELLFYVIVGVDTTDGIEELEKLGLELELVPWSPQISISGREGEAQFSTEATFTQVIALAKVDMVRTVKAETDWHKDYRTLSECRKKLDGTIRLVVEHTVFLELYSDIVVAYHPYIFRKNYGIERRDGEVYFLELTVVTDSGTEKIRNATLPQIIALAKLENVHKIKVILPEFLPPPIGEPQ